MFNVNLCILDGKSHLCPNHSSTTATLVSILRLVVKTDVQATICRLYTASCLMLSLTLTSTVFVIAHLKLPLSVSLIGIQLDMTHLL